MKSKVTLLGAAALIIASACSSQQGDATLSPAPAAAAVNEASSGSTLRSGALLNDAVKAFIEAYPGTTWKDSNRAFRYPVLASGNIDHSAVPTTASETAIRIPWPSDASPESLGIKEVRVTQLSTEDTDVSLRWDVYADDGSLVGSIAVERQSAAGGNAPLRLREAAAFRVPNASNPNDYIRNSDESVGDCSDPTGTTKLLKDGHPEFAPFVNLIEALIVENFSEGAGAQEKDSCDADAGAETDANPGQDGSQGAGAANPGIGSGIQTAVWKRVTGAGAVALVVCGLYLRDRAMNARVGRIEALLGDQASRVAIQARQMALNTLQLSVLAHPTGGVDVQLNAAMQKIDQLLTQLSALQREVGSNAARMARNTNALAQTNNVMDRWNSAFSRDIRALQGRLKLPLDCPLW